MTPQNQPEPQSDELDEKLIKHMVDRFLGWKLPADFQPDAGISFKPTFNNHMAHPMKYEPVGTNLFSAAQAEEMVRYMLAGKPVPDPNTPTRPTDNQGITPKHLRNLGNLPDPKEPKNAPKDVSRPHKGSTEVDKPIISHPKESSNTAKCLCGKGDICPIHDNPFFPKEPSVLDEILSDPRLPVLLASDNAGVRRREIERTKRKILKHYVARQEVEEALKKGTADRNTWVDGTLLVNPDEIRKRLGIG